MAARIPHILERLASLETAVKHSDTMLKSSVDDIKATIRSEIFDLKSEQIADVKAALKQLGERVESQSLRLARLERAQDQWKTAGGVVNWLIRAAIGIGGILIGIFGYRHLGAGP
jgi:Flp pilus assembly protein TadB